MLVYRIGICYNNYILYNNSTDIDRYFEDISVYIPGFMQSLWDSPESIATILATASVEDIKNNLAHFVASYLYENIVSSDSQEDQLLYILTLLLKEEIKNLNVDDDTFLKDKSPSGYILEELLDKKDVKFYFKNIIKSIMKKIEIILSLNSIIFDPVEISETLNKGKIINENKEIKNKIKEKIKTVEIKYLTTLTEKEMKEKCKEFNNNEITNFLNEMIIKCKEDPYKYSFENLIEIILVNKQSQKLFEYYKESYAKVIDIIDLLLETILKTSKSLPYFIKCICKVISVLIKKKFPEKCKMKQNIFLAKFFFGKLLFEAFKNPALCTLLNEYLILGKTMDIIRVVVCILDKIMSGNFFEKDDNLVPFNNYLIEKLPILIEIFDEISQVTLPSFIDNLINDKLPKDYKYDYFKEHPDENIFYRHICFNVDILYSLIINAQKCKDKIQINSKASQKLLLKLDVLDKLKNSETNDKKNIKFFLLSDTINNETYKKILKIKREKNYFTLKEIKNPETKQEQTQNSLIKVKNFFFSFLYNNPTLNINDISKENTTDIIKILKEIKNNANKNPYIYSNQNSSKTNSLLDSLIQYLPLLEQRGESSNVFIEDKLKEMTNILKTLKQKTTKKTLNQYQKPIPIKWFLGSLIEYLPKLPEEYIKNDYEKLLNELEQDVNNSIKQLDFEFVGNTIDHLREIEKKKFYYQNVKNIIIDIDLNKKVNSIIEKEKIPVKILFDNSQLKLNIEPIIVRKRSILFSLMGDNDEKNKNIEALNCQTIKSFTEKFPDLTEYEIKQDLNMIDVLEKMQLPSILDVYFHIIEEYLKQKKLTDENNSENINNKIYDYIMEQLNDKLFPKDSDNISNEIYRNYIKLAWIQPKHLITFRKEYILDYYLPDAITYFQRINEEKSPRKKFICLNELFNCIYNLGKFNDDKVEGADDEMNLLSYTFIKAKTPNIYLNCKYMSLFLGKKESKLEGNQLNKILSLCELFAKFSYNDISNISETDYYQNIELAIEGKIFE